MDYLELQSVTRPLCRNRLFFNFIFCSYYSHITIQRKDWNSQVTVKQKNISVYFTLAGLNSLANSIGTHWGREVGSEGI